MLIVVNRVAEMNPNLSIFFVFLVCQFGKPAVIISTPSPSETFDSTIEHFRDVFTSFPCANRAITNRIFNTMNLALNPKYAHFPKRDAAKIEWLYLMVIGNNSNVSVEQWRDIFNKTVEAYSQTNQHIKEEKIKQIREMLEQYLIKSQIHRFDLYLSEAEKQITSFDGEIFNRYFFGFPIGIALGIPEDDIAEILEDDVYGNQAIDYLGRLAHLICEIRHPSVGDRRTKQNIIRDLRKALEVLLNRSQQA